MADYLREADPDFQLASQGVAVPWERRLLVGGK